MYLLNQMELIIILTITSVSFACNNGEYPIGSGIITSPNYPNYYDDNAYCQYVLHANEAIYNPVVNLTFDEFATEVCCDSLMIYDGPDVRSRLIQRLNGTVHRKRSFLSTQPYMTLRFETDNSGADTGFSARYLTASHESIVCPNSYHTINQGQVSSPKYPQNYSNDHDCTYLIATDLPGRRLQISFDAFSTDNINDQLIIYDGTSSLAPVIATLYGRPEMPIYFISTTEYLFLRFKTDSTGVDRGFHASYLLIDEPPQSGTTKRLADVWSSM